MRFLELLFIARRRDYTAVKKLRDLNRSNANTRARAQNKHGLPRTNACQSDQHVPRRDEYERDTGCLIEIERVWNGNHICDRSCEEFTVSSVNGVADHRKFAALILEPGKAFCAVSAEMHWSDQDALTRFESGDVFANLDDFADDVAAENVRQLHAGQSLAHPHVQMIKRARFHPDQHLIFAWL